MNSPSARCAGTAVIAIACACLACLPAIAHASGLTTTWQSTMGNWSDGANWSDGEPTDAVGANIPPQSSVTIDQLGESSLYLHVGTGSKGFGAQVNMIFGSLVVEETLHTGTAATFTTGTFTQTSGTVTAPLVIAERGGYTASGGTTTIDECRLEGGSFTVLGGANVTVTTDVTIEISSFFTVGGGTLLAGTTPAHAVVVRGELALVNRNVEVSMQNLSLDGSNSRLRATIGALSIDPIAVVGTFARDGQFIVNDVSAPDGRYDILTAGAITGEFANVELPATGDWSWGIDGTTLYVVKGEMTPTEAASWGRVKNRFTPHP